MPRIAIRLHAIAVVWIATFHLSNGACGQDTWPQWRGPNRDGTLNQAVWPSALKEENLHELWRTELQPSYSGPIVGVKHVYVTETRDKQVEVVQALNRETGERVWEAQWDGAMKVPFFASANGSWIRSTPVLDEGRLYVGGMRDVLVCLNANSGDELWRIDFVEQFESGLPAFGFVCSPMIDGDFLYVQAGASVAKVNKKNGEVVWRALEDKGGMFGSAFSSPDILELNGRRQLVVQTRTTLAGLDLETGEELWSQEIPAFRGMNILTPTAFGDSVFTSSYGGKSLLFEIDGESVEERWQNKEQAYMSTPVLIDGHAYMHLRNERFACIDLESGMTKWKSKPHGKYCSLVANGNRILALDQRGYLLLIEADPEKFELTSRVQIADDETWAHLAVVGNELFVRELNAMVVYKWK